MIDWFFICAIILILAISLALLAVHVFAIMFTQPLLLHTYFTLFIILFQISPPKGSSGDSCMWNCMFWEIYNSNSACSTSKFTKCFTGMLITGFFVLAYWPNVIIVRYYDVFFVLKILQTDMVYELLRTSTEYEEIPCFTVHIIFFPTSCVFPWFILSMNFEFFFLFLFLGFGP